MKALVTGGTGFLGKYLVDRLVEEGFYVRVLDYHGASEWWGRHSRSVDLRQGDIRDLEIVKQSCNGIHVVYHLAALPSIARGTRRLYGEVNVNGTRNLLQAACDTGISKVVYVSSSTVYGIPAVCPTKEDDPLRPIGAYSRSKVAAEEVCWEFAGRGLSVSIIRPRVIMGPGRIGIFSLLFNRVRSSKPVYLIGNGRNTFQFTGVYDMVDACLLASRYLGSDVFNIGARDVQPVRRELQALIMHAASRSRIVGVPAGLARSLLGLVSLAGISPLVKEQFMIADRDFRLDTTKAERLLGWVPKQTNIGSLLDAYGWWLNHLGAISSQYRILFGPLGRFRHSHMGAFQTSSKTKQTKESQESIH